MKSTLLTLLAAMAMLPAAGQKFVGYMTYNASWMRDNGNYPECGWCTYDLSTGTFDKPTNDDYVMKAGTGGAFAEGRLYSMESANDSWLMPDPKFHTFDAATFAPLATVSYGRSDRDHATKDFAYNPATKALYAVAQHRNGNTADGGWLQCYDLATGAMTHVAHLPVYQQALAIAADGTCYTLSEDGTLNRVELPADTKGGEADARLVAIGKTGYRLQGDITYANSLCFDHRTERLYWAASAYREGDYGGTNNAVRGIFEIDITTGAATLLSEFPNNILLTALDIVNNGLTAPDDITDMALHPQEPGSNLVDLSFTVPAQTYGQQTYADGKTLTVHLVADGHPVEEQWTRAAGEAFRATIEIPNGLHTVGAYVVNDEDGLTSQVAEQTLWVGFDTPRKPDGLTLDFNRDRNAATLTWEPVTEGVHGGAIDLNTLSYIVTRRADNGASLEDIAYRITENTYTDYLDIPMSYTGYEVIAMTDGFLSATARTAYTSLGQPRELPFMSTFSYLGEFHQFITIDANGDGWDDWETPSWYFDSTYGAAFCYLNRQGLPQDDWLVTPALDFEVGEDYEVIFQTYGYYGEAYAPCHLQIAVGTYADPDGLQRVVYDKSYSVAMPQHFPFEADDVLTDHVIFTAQEGENYVGFHNITDAFDHMSIDNIYIRRAEASGVLRPEYQTDPLATFDLSGRRAAAGEAGIRIVGGRKTIR